MNCLGHCDLTAPEFHANALTASNGDVFISKRSKVKSARTWKKSATRLVGGGTLLLFDYVIIITLLLHIISLVALIRVPICTIKLFYDLFDFNMVNK